MKTKKLGMCLFAVVVSASALVAGRSWMGSLATADPAVFRSVSPTLIFNRKLVSTSFSLNNDIIVVGPGKQAVDSPLTFTCPKGGCTVTADVHVQMGENTKAQNLFAVCADLDGGDMAPGCPNIASIPTDETFIGATFAFANSNVAPGTHTLQGFVYTTFGASRAYYSITYRLYTP